MSEIAAERDEVLSPGDLILARREDLANAWEKHLASIAGTSGVAGGVGGPASHDLLSILTEASSKSAEFSEDLSEVLVSQLDIFNIGLADLYAQIEALKNAFQTVFGETENRNIAAAARIALDRAAYELIRRRAALHEQAMEFGPIGVAELDASGEELPRMPIPPCRGYWDRPPDIWLLCSRRAIAHTWNGRSIPRRKEPGRSR